MRIDEIEKIDERPKALDLSLSLRPSQTDCSVE